LRFSRSLLPANEAEVIVTIAKRQSSFFTRQS
jgi:hypothetical protein